MSATYESNFLMSALQPNTPVSSLALPSEQILGNKRYDQGPYSGGQQVKSDRVQEQVRMRLLQKSVKSSGTATLPHNYGGAATFRDSITSSTSKYNTCQPGFTSKSFMLSNESQKISTAKPQYGTARTGNWSSQSAVDVGYNRRYNTISSTGPRQKEVFMNARSQTVKPQSTLMGSSRSGRREMDTMSFRSLQISNGPAYYSRMDDEMSLGSDQVDHTVGTPSRASYYMSESSEGGQYGRNYTMDKKMSTGNGIGSQSAIMRSYSGTFPKPSSEWMDVEERVTQNKTIRAPAMRTLQRFQNTNRNRNSTGSFISMGQQSSSASMVQTDSGAEYGGIVMQQLSRAPSMKSMVLDSTTMPDLQEIQGQKDFLTQQAICSGFDNIDLQGAVRYLSASDSEMQVIGAAYIQHKCYNDDEAKLQTRKLLAIPKLVKLFNSENQEVQRHATGAVRNLIYNNNDNKLSLIEEDGVAALMRAIREPDDELQKNVTGILWNLSSSDSLKDRLSSEIMNGLTEKVLVPLSGSGKSGVIRQNASESEIFYNATGCLRNLSSASVRTREKMRECRGLIDSMVQYIQNAMDSGKVEDKSVENAACVLRNLSFRLYDELPSEILARLEGPGKQHSGGKKNETVGCFTPQSKKVKEESYSDYSTFTEVSKDPKGMEWLWNPKIVSLYTNLLQKCEVNHNTTEAAAGAMQNITAGDRRWPSILSKVALHQSRILNPLLDRLRTNSDQELKSLTGLLRNLSRHTKNKDELSTKVVSHLVEKLPSCESKTNPSDDVVVNICAVLNNLVMESSLAARDVCYFDGIAKLMYVKKKKDSQEYAKASRAAMVLLNNMWQYGKYHKEYKKKGFGKPDFTSM
ncbi:plakophilin-3 [Protopterus annectens]|uniref:plakophilin-3 n=1 Tax=Protopterus annectens TaxID=7888 RepID=UPI001CFB1409|nr:plakophilin-3 [Protopterus annectens]